MSKLLNVPLAVFLILLCIVDAMVRLTSNIETNTRPLEGLVNASLNTPSQATLSKIDTWLLTETTSSDDTTEILADDSVDKINEALQEGELESLYINSVEYRLLGVFKDDNKASAAILKPMKPEVSTITLSKDMTLQEYLVVEITMTSITFESPSKKQITLKVFTSNLERNNE